MNQPERDNVDLRISQLLDRELREQDVPELQRELLRSTHARATHDDFARVDALSHDALHHAVLSSTTVLSHPAHHLNRRWRVLTLASGIAAAAAVALTVFLLPDSSAPVAPVKTPIAMEAEETPPGSFMAPVSASSRGTPVTVDEIAAELDSGQQRGRWSDDGFYSYYDDQTQTLYWLRTRRQTTLVQPVSMDL